jgi:hypothetical protein
MTPINPRDHRAWLAYWSERLLAGIADAVAHPGASGEDFRLQWVVHCARIAHGRALKVRPRLKLVNL